MVEKVVKTVSSSGHEYYSIDSDTSLLHREDGPSIKFTDGRFAWYLYNVQYSFVDYIRITQMSPEDQQFWKEEIIIGKLQNGLLT
jgi:hypothetical protein